MDALTRPEILEVFVPAMERRQSNVIYLGVSNKPTAEVSASAMEEEKLVMLRGAKV